MVSVSEIVSIAVHYITQLSLCLRALRALVKRSKLLVLSRTLELSDMPQHCYCTTIPKE